MTSADDRAVVQGLLARSGLTLSEAEIEAMTAGLPLVRQTMQRLYSMPGVRYEEPALAFDPRVDVE